MKKELSFIIALLISIGGYNCMDMHKNAKKTCDTIYESGNKMPEFKGGQMELLKYNREEIAPIIGAFNKRTGAQISKVYYSLIISKTGAVVGSEIRSDVDKQLKNDLQEAFKKMPLWTPGEVNGQNACMKINVPISCIKWD